ncbi:MAG TPA: pilus assembly protein N-terminal domain-containing protein [Candidatus Binatia bacterium]|nr:pilus assembly protein N-terminal domain-containing protein [Candidatus Binatia bacterium]
MFSPFRTLRPLLLGSALSLLGALAVPAVGAPEQPARVYLGLNQYRILELGEAARKVAVASPSIADVQVLNPTQILLTGKAVGVTSLVVFGARARQTFDLVVHPAPVGGASLPPDGASPYTVRVQRGDRLTEQVFARDGEQRWLELGPVKPEADAVKK